MATIKSYTDIEQSKRLAEILPIESADMCFINNKPQLGFLCEEYHEFGDTILQDYYPSWSLAALLDVIPEGQVNRMAYSDKWEASSWYDSDFEPTYYVEDYDNPIDACYELILNLHEHNLL